MNSIGSGLVDGVRDDGHALAEQLGISTGQGGELLDRATRWVDTALTVGGCATSGRASLRLSCSRRLVVVEVTHDDPGTFDTLMLDDATRNAVEELRAWAGETGHALTIERGLDDQFRITVAREP